MSQTLFHTLIDRKRLTEISPDTLLAHMTDPRIAGHLPLLKTQWTRQTALDVIAAKEAFWQRDGLGHWGFECAGRYVGWGGFQKEGDEWDFGLVLTAEAFGLGPRLTRDCLNFARRDARIPYVTFLLPPSRQNLRALARLGADFVGEIDHEGERFRKFQVETSG